MTNVCFMLRAGNLYILLIFFLFCASCRNRNQVKKSDLVVDISEMDTKVKENILSIIDYSEKNKRLTPDSILLDFFPVVKYFYEDEEHGAVWSHKGLWNPASDSLVNFLEHAAYYGLFQNDYEILQLKRYRSLLSDSVKRMDATLWANADAVYTNSFVKLLQDLGQGRLQPDSLARQNDTAQQRIFFTTNINALINGRLFSSIIESVQPAHEGYRLLKSGMKNFVDSMDHFQYTYIDFPYRDTIAFYQSLRKRFAETGIVVAANADSTRWSGAIKTYQQKCSIKTDGKAGPELVKTLNNTDRQKFNRIAVTLDRYKQLPATMPEKYIWVNLPGNYLKVWNSDTVALESKVICGKPGTATPIITSSITDIIIYPTWTVPTSIITKDMLPGLKRNSNYLSRKGMYLLNNKGERIDPAGVNWERYTKGIPYRIQQGSGDDNALGVIKFNFNNPYSVYLHDTNQRYLFKNSMRSLSHGCVRVQEWQKLANIIIRNDSLLNKGADTLRYNTDSITSWIANKERHSIFVKNKFALFIRYFTCEFTGGSLKFYDDIYGDDRALMRKYFAGK